MGQKFTNNASALITSNIGPGSLSFTIESAFADRFPALVSGDWFVGTLQNIAGDIEIIRVNKRDVGSNAIQNVVRGQEGTTALTFAAGEAVFGVRATAAHFQEVKNHVDAQTDAHGAAAITFAPTPEILSTNAQDAIVEVRADAIAAVATSDAAQAAALAQHVSIAALVAQTHTALTSTGTAPAFILTPTPPLTAYAAFQRFNIKPHAASAAGENTLNISGLGAKLIKAYAPSGVKADAIFYANQMIDAVYDGADFVVFNTPGYSEPPADIHFTATPTQAPGTRRILIQGQALERALYPSLDFLWCGSSLNNHADPEQKADFFYRCVDPANPSTTRSDLGAYLVMPPPGYFLRPINTGTTGANASRKRFKLQEDEVKAHVHRMPFTWYGGYTPDNYTGHSTPYSAASALDTASVGGPENIVKNWPVYVWMSY